MPSLPDHVWYLVLSLFEDDIPLKRWQSSEPARPNRANVEVLLSLCLVSRQLRDVAQPMLYRTFHLASSCHEQYVCGLIIRSLVARPRLGQAIGAISLYNWDVLARPLQMYMDTDYGRWFAGLLKEARTLLGLPPAVNDRLDAALSPMPSGTGLDTLILALTPRVRLVDATVPPTVLKYVPSPLPWILGGQEDEPVRHGLSKCCLPHLTEVRLKRSPYHRENFDMVELEPLLLHPTLKILRVSKFECKERHVSKLKWPDRVSKLETLELRRCILDMTGMKNILTRCSNVRQLAIHFDPEPALDQATTFNLTVFGQMLRELARDLIELDLNTVKYREHGLIQGEIESLRELDSLRCLKLTPRDLGSPAPLNGKLPRFLESLVLYCDALSGYGREQSEDLAKLITTDGDLNLRVTVEE